MKRFSFLSILLVLFCASLVQAETIKINFWQNTSTITTYLFIDNPARPYYSYPGAGGEEIFGKAPKPSRYANGGYIPSIYHDYSSDQKDEYCFMSFPDYDAINRCNTPWFDMNCKWPWTLQDSQCILDDGELLAHTNTYDQRVSVELHYSQYTSNKNLVVEKSWYYTGLICVQEIFQLSTKMSIWTELIWNYDFDPSVVWSLCGHSTANHKLVDPALCNLTFSDSVDTNTYGHGYIHNMGRQHFIGRYNDPEDGMKYECFNCPDTLESNPNMRYRNCHWPIDKTNVYGYIVDETTGMAVPVEFSDTPDINEDGNCDRCMNSQFPGWGNMGGLSISPWDLTYYYGDPGGEWDRNGDNEFDRSPRIMYPGKRMGE